MEGRMEYAIEARVYRDIRGFIDKIMRVVW